MPCLIIETQPDGTVKIAAPAQVPPEMLADAETVESLEQAAQVMQDVLGADQGSGRAVEPDADQTGGAPDGDADNMGGAAQPAAEGAMDPMEQGFRNVRGAPRR